MSLDGEQMDLYETVAPKYCDEATNLKAFAVLIGAAAAASARFTDRLDLGKNISQEERDEWIGLTHLCMRIADYHTWGSAGTRDEVMNALFCLYETMSQR